MKKVLTSKPAKVVGVVVLVAAGCYVGFLIGQGPSFTSLLKDVFFTKFSSPARRLAVTNKLVKKFFVPRFGPIKRDSDRRLFLGEGIHWFVDYLTGTYCIHFQSCHEKDTEMLHRMAKIVEGHVNAEERPLKVVWKEEGNQRGFEIKHELAA